jgi:Domain of unknown function (DUF4062)
MVERFRAFVASPGDVSAERTSLSDVIKEIDEVHGPALGYGLDLIKWETHTAPGAGPPQQVINEQIGKYDVFIGIMWRRFGTPTLVAGSGTEEEYRNAWNAWQNNKDLIIMFYFCQRPFMPTSRDEIAQMEKVLGFREELEGKALAWKYTEENEFESAVRKHLCMRLNRIVTDRRNGATFRATPDDKSIDEFRALWTRMDPGLRMAISIAYNENRQAGDPGIQTRDLFSAFLRVGTPDIVQIAGELPEQALPSATSGVVTDEPYIINERPWLSGCVSSSIHRLLETLPPDRSLTSADIFADIAKNGSGTSVQLLRENNIRPQDIDQILRRQNIRVVDTQRGSRI